MEQSALESWFQQFPLLGQAYELKESFYNIWQHKYKKDAAHAYNEWYNSIPLELLDYFGPVAKAVDNWHKQIFNYFTHPYTNATTEALNGLIKIMNRNGRGYTFDVLRSKILLTHGFHKEKTRPRKFNRISDDRMMMDLPPEISSNYGTFIQRLVDFFEQNNCTST